MKSRRSISLGIFPAVLVLLAMCGCSSSSESASSDKMTQSVGVYPPPPPGVYHPRVGVPPFTVQSPQGFLAGGDINDLAADEMTTLLDQYGGFRVIERAQLQQLLKEQNLEGIVNSGEMARQGQVRGVDYLLLGKVTDLRVKRESTNNNFNVGQFGGNLFGAGAVDNSKQKLTTECGVDIRMVDPSTGEVAWSNFSEFKRTDSASAMGLTILGASAQANADVELSEDDKGKILRMALDGAIKKSMPKIERFLRNQPTSRPSTE